MQFVETQVFTRRLLGLGLEGQLRSLQLALIENPTAGDVERGTGGLRKVRIADPGRNKGKRGGARVHYLYLEPQQTIYLIYVYGKDDQDVLGPAQRNVLRAIAVDIRASQR